MGLVWLWVLLSWAMQCCATSDVFNWEVANRAVDNIRGFLNQVYFPTSQVKDAFELGFFNHTSPTFYNDVHSLLYSELQMTSPIGAVYAMLWDDVFVALTKQDRLIFTTDTSHGFPCAIQLSSQICVRVSFFDNTGQPTLALSSVPVAPDNVGVPRQANATWSSVYQIGASTLAIGFSLPFRDPSGTVGHAMASVTLARFDQFLNEAFGSDGDQRVVYVVEEGTGLLIAASESNVTVVSQGFAVAQQRASACSNALIRLSHEYLLSLGHIETAQLYLHEGYYIQITPYTDVNVNWYIVVVRPVEVGSDEIAPHSTAYIVLACLCALSLFATAVQLVWVVRFRTMRLWKAAQPSLLVLVLVANALCSGSGFSLIGSPTAASCMARLWLVPLSVTLTCATFVAKLFRVYFMTSSRVLFESEVRNVLTTRRSLEMISLIVGLQLVLLALWAALDPMRPQMRYQDENGVAVAYHVCFSSLWGGVAPGILIGVLVICGMVLSVKTRNLSSTFAESNALMLVFYHGTFILVLLLMIKVFVTVKTASLLLLFVLSMVWFSGTTQLALFFPRIYRQVTLGDFTQWEIKDKLVQHLHRSTESNPTFHFESHPKPPTTPPNNNKKSPPTAKPEIIFVI